MKSATNILLLVFAAATLAGCGALLDTRVSRREAAAELAVPPEWQFLDVDGTRVHARVTGSGPDLVLIHGAGGNTRDFSFRLTRWLERRYRVIAIDRPGLGYTDRLPGYSGPTNNRSETLIEQADLMRKTAAKLGAKKPIVLGQSYGGSVALAWAVAFPEDLSALVLVSPASNPWEGGLSSAYNILGSKLGGALVAPLATAFVPKSVTDKALRDIFYPQPVPEGYGEFIGVGLALRRETLRANAQQVSDLNGQLRVLSRSYGEIDVPTEIVHGTEDQVVGIRIHSDRLVKMIPDANLVRLRGIGHMPHQVATDQVVAAIDRAARRAGLHPDG